MTYSPRGFPKAAIDHITEHGPQFTGPLAEAIGCDPGSLSNILAAAVQNGALVRVRKPHMGHNVNFYSLGDGVPLERPKDEPLEDHTAFDDPEPNSRPRVATAAESVLRKRAEAFAPDAPDALDLPDAPTCTKSQTRAMGVPCEFAITSTGRLLIDTGVQQVALSKDQAEQLMAYLDAHRGIEWEVA